MRRRWTCTNCQLNLPTGPLYALLCRTQSCRAPILDQIYEDHRRDLPAPLFLRTAAGDPTRTVTLNGRTSHPTHALLFYRGVYYCNRCGCVATTELHSLWDRCKPRRPMGASNLSRLRRSPPVPPSHIQKTLGGWPNADNAAVPYNYNIPIVTRRTIPKLVSDPSKSSSG